MNNLQRKINKETERRWYKLFYAVEDKFEGQTIVDGNKELTEAGINYIEEMFKIPCYEKIRKEVRKEYKKGKLLLFK